MDLRGGSARKEPQRRGLKSTKRKNVKKKLGKSPKRENGGDNKIT
jgi:hypothetical protein